MAPSGKFILPSKPAIDFVTAECKAKINDNLAEWVFEPAVNLTMGFCQAAGMCPVEFGDLPLAAFSEETVSFSLHKDLFGDLLRSYGSGALSIGDSLILFCSVQGMKL